MSTQDSMLTTNIFINLDWVFEYIDSNPELKGYLILVVQYLRNNPEVYVDEDNSFVDAISMSLHLDVCNGEIELFNQEETVTPRHSWLSVQDIPDSYSSYPVYFSDGILCQVDKNKYSEEMQRLWENPREQRNCYYLRDQGCRYRYTKINNRTSVDVIIPLDNFPVLGKYSMRFSRTKSANNFSLSEDVQ